MKNSEFKYMSGRKMGWLQENFPSRGKGIAAKTVCNHRFESDFLTKLFSAFLSKVVFSACFLGFGAIQIVAAEPKPITVNAWRDTTELPEMQSLTGDVYQIHAANRVLGIEGDAAGNSCWTSYDRNTTSSFVMEWFIVPTGGKVNRNGVDIDTYYIVSRYNGKALTMTDQRKDLSPIALNAVGAGAQMWYFYPAADGTGFQIQNDTYNGGMTGNSNMTNSWTMRSGGSSITLKKARGYETSLTMPAEKVKYLPSFKVVDGSPEFPDEKKAIALSFTYLPAHAVKDPGMTERNKYRTTPLYKLQKETLINRVVSFDNLGNDAPANPTYSYSTGILRSDMQSRTDTVSVSVTGGTGDASPVKLEVTLGYEAAFTTELRNETSSSESKGATFQVEPGSIGALYSQKYRFTILRLDGTKIGKPWEVMGASDFKAVSWSK